MTKQELIELLETVQNLSSPPPWEQHYGYNNGGCPTAFFKIPQHNGGHEVEMLAEDARAIVELRNNLPNILRFLKMFTYEYNRPALTVDAVVFGVDEEGLKVLLIQRLDDPFKDYWALPGGFVEVEDDDTTDDAVARELQEETGVEALYLEQLYTFSKKGRDPRERVVSVAYYGLVKPSVLKLEAGSDAKEVKWTLVKDLPPLAFDHAEIIQKGLERLRGKVRYQPVGFELLPEEFTLGDIQRLYEELLQRKLDPGNFRKRILSTGVIQALDFERVGAVGRPAQLYRFDREQYDQKVKDGYNFEV